MSDPTYEQAWRRFRAATKFLKIAEWLWFLPLVVLLAGIALFQAVPEATQWRGVGWGAFGGTLVVALVLRVAADISVKSFRCPRCDKPFVQLSILQRAPLYTIKHRFPCQHCRLPVGAVSANADNGAA